MNKLKLIHDNSSPVCNLPTSPQSTGPHWNPDHFILGDILPLSGFQEYHWEWTRVEHNYVITISCQLFSYCCYESTLCLCRSESVMWRMNVRNTLLLALRLRAQCVSHTTVCKASFHSHWFPYPKSDGGHEPVMVMALSGTEQVRGTDTMHIAWGQVIPIYLLSSGILCRPTWCSRLYTLFHNYYYNLYKLLHCIPVEICILDQPSGLCLNFSFFWYIYSTFSYLLFFTIYHFLLSFYILHLTCSLLYCDNNVFSPWGQ